MGVCLTRVPTGRLPFGSPLAAVLDHGQARGGHGRAEFDQERAQVHLDGERVPGRAHHEQRQGDDAVE
jgi:hypothetical protein